MSIANYICKSTINLPCGQMFLPLFAKNGIKKLLLSRFSSFLVIVFAFFCFFVRFFMPFCPKTNIENGGFCGSNPAFFGIFGLFSASRLPTVVWQPTDPKPLTR